jgi:hypothetical protein
LNQNLRIANELFENAAKFKYLGMTLTNQNDSHDEIKSRLNSGNAYYHLVQNLLSSHLRAGQPRSHRTDENAEDVWNLVHSDRCLSIRGMAMQLNLDKETVDKA